MAHDAIHGGFCEIKFYVTLLGMITRSKKSIGALLLSILLVLSMVPFVGAAPAYGDELSDAQATLDAASKELDALSSEYSQLQAQVADLDAQINDAAQKVQEAQTAMIEGQQVLGDAMLAEYKSDGGLSLVNIVLSSEDISDFVVNMTYYSAIQQDQAEKVAEQRELNETFSAALSELDAQRDAQQTVLDQAASKKAEAEKVVSDASAKVSSIKESQAALEALQAKANEMNNQGQSSGGQTEDSGWNTKPDAPSSGGGGSSSGGSGGSGSDSGNSNTGTDSSKGWKTGLASAYGGSSDPYTPNPGVTATGAVCDDNSWGVAIPMSWSNYRSYFGRAVEVNYGGKTIVTTINDCGGLSGGARSLDLQPGVFKAFGFKTCQAWDVRTVSYRIL